MTFGAPARVWRPCFCRDRHYSHLCKGIRKLESLKHQSWSHLFAVPSACRIRPVLLPLLSAIQLAKYLCLSALSHGERDSRHIPSGKSEPLLEGCCQQQCCLPQGRVVTGMSAPSQPPLMTRSVFVLALVDGSDARPLTRGQQIGAMSLSRKSVVFETPLRQLPPKPTSSKRTQTEPMSK
jgi:hypothetical protein